MAGACGTDSVERSLSIPVGARPRGFIVGPRNKSEGDGGFEEGVVTTPSAEVLDRLKAALGPGGWSDDPDRVAPKLVEWRSRWRGETPLLLLPRTAQEVAAAVLFLCLPEAAAVNGAALPVSGGEA